VGRYAVSATKGIQMSGSPASSWIGGQVVSEAGAVNLDGMTTGNGTCSFGDVTAGSSGAVTINYGGLHNGQAVGGTVSAWPRTPTGFNAATGTARTGTAAAFAAAAGSVADAISGTRGMASYVASGRMASTVNAGIPPSGVVCGLRAAQTNEKSASAAECGKVQGASAARPGVQGTVAVTASPTNASHLTMTLRGDNMAYNAFNVSLADLLRVRNVSISVPALSAVAVSVHLGGLARPYVVTLRDLSVTLASGLPASAVAWIVAEPAPLPGSCTECELVLYTYRVEWRGSILAPMMRLVGYDTRIHGALHVRAVENTIGTSVLCPLWMGGVDPSRAAKPGLAVA
jgi:hypothetical protein